MGRHLTSKRLTALAVACLAAATAFFGFTVADLVAQEPGVPAEGFCQRQPDHWKCDVTVTIPPDTTTVVTTEPGPTTTVTTTVTTPSASEGGAIDPPAVGLWVGIRSTGGTDTAFASVESQARKAFKIRQYFPAWHNDGVLQNLPAAEIEENCSRGIIPELTWEPNATGSTNLVPAINRGEFDSYIATNARIARDASCDVFIRLFHELNGSWYSYGACRDSTDTVCSTPDATKQAYRRIAGIFDTQGASDDVSFVYAPSMPQGNWEAWYPGDDVVDWVSGDGYNKCCSRWLDYTEVLHWDRLSTGDGQGWYDWAVTKAKPLSVSEEGCAEATQTGLDPPDKATWVRRQVTAFKTHPRIRAWVHSNYMDPDGSNWRIDSSSATLTAYQETYADSYFAGR